MQLRDKSELPKLIEHLSPEDLQELARLIDVRLYPQEARRG
jgi:hypothetical protein